MGQTNVGQELVVVFLGKSVSGEPLGPGHEGDFGPTIVGNVFAQGLNAVGVQDLAVRARHGEIGVLVYEAFGAGFEFGGRGICPPL